MFSYFAHQFRYKDKESVMKCALKLRSRASHEASIAEFFHAVGNTKVCLAKCTQDHEVAMLGLENLLHRSNDLLRRVLGDQVPDDEEAAIVIRVDGAEPLEELADNLEVAIRKPASGGTADIEVVAGVELGDEGVKDDLELLTASVHLEKSHASLPAGLAVALGLEVLKGLDGGDALRNNVDLLSLAPADTVGVAPEELAAKILDRLVTEPADVAASGFALQSVEEVANLYIWSSQ